MSGAVEHWFDFTCPYCYLAQDRNRILGEHGITVLEHGLQIHPEIGPGGTPAGPRVGPQYEFLARRRVRRQQHAYLGHRRSAGLRPAPPRVVRRVGHGPQRLALQLADEVLRGGQAPGLDQELAELVLVGGGQVDLQPAEATR